MDTMNNRALMAKVEAARRAWYRAANPGETAQRRETTIADLNRRQLRVRALKAKYDSALAALEEKVHVRA
jgi:hypothetical protein